MEKVSKSIRVLEIYNRLKNGEVIKRYIESNRYEVSEKTIDRDMDEIKEMLARERNEKGTSDEIIFDHDLKGHRLKRVYESKLSKSEILAICKILLDSRAFTKIKIDQIIEKLISCCAIEEEQQVLHKLLNNEKYYYVELQNKKEILERMWDIGQAIQNQNYMNISYEKLTDSGRKIVKRKVRPAAIMFSEFYFYMAAFIEDKQIKKDFNLSNEEYPTIYRINRIQELNVLDEKFKIPSYGNRFQEGEFRKRIQFMYGGKLRRIKLKCKEFSLEAVLDRFPTAQIQSEKDGIYTIVAEIYGNGVDMWLRGQEKNVEIIEGKGVF